MTNPDTTSQPDIATTRFTADAHFRMGSAHENEGSPCQDYALAETTQHRAFAIASDGCSTSGHTDLGSRILTLGARDFLRRSPHWSSSRDLLDTLRDAVLATASDAMSLFDLELGDLDATLAVVAARSDRQVATVLMGDGAIAVRRPSGLEVVITDWAGNMPGYPGYLLTEDRRAAFEAASEAFGREQGRAPLRIERYAVSDEGEAVLQTTEGRSARDGLRGLALEWGADGDVVAVTTDGIQQVGDLPWALVIQELTAVKAAREGTFMTRRMTRALAGMAKLGHRPIDDISVAALAAVTT